MQWQNTNTTLEVETIVESELAILEPLISGHDVGRSPICPASVFHELVLEATAIMLETP